jgi:hypothetical protein
MIIGPDEGYFEPIKIAYFLGKRFLFDQILPKAILRKT